MNRLSCDSWTFGQLLDEWNYRYEERLGMLCGSTEPELWMMRLAVQDANRAIESIVWESPNKKVSDAQTADKI